VPPEYQRPVVYSEQFGNGTFWVYDENDASVKVGYLHNTLDHKDYAYAYWYEGTTLHGNMLGMNCYALSINNLNQVIVQGPGATLICNADNDFFSVTGTGARGISDSGAIIGNNGLYEGGAWHDLDEFVSTAEWNVQYAAFIDDSGWILAKANPSVVLPGSDPPFDVLLKPIPEPPATLSGFLAAVLTFAGLHCKHQQRLRGTW
jgi:hypothetical protein